MADKGQIAARIGHLADRQHGHVTRQQLLELGLPERTISYRITAGDLVVVHAGVYALGHAERHALAVAHAAVLACGYEAALSHDSAGASWEIGDWPYTPEVTAPSRRPRPGIRTHRSTTLAGDVWTRHGIRTTSPVRTICDVASRRTDVQLTRLVQNARLKGHLSDAKLRQLLLRCPRVKDLVDPGQRPTRSTLEDDFVRWLKTHHLPMPQLNVMLNAEVDAPPSLVPRGGGYHPCPPRRRTAPPPGRPHPPEGRFPVVPAGGGGFGGRCAACCATERSCRQVPAPT